MKINEIIVVEGKHDTITIQNCVEADTIETHGTSLNLETLDYIKEMQKLRGVIVFTDPDTPGDKIRHRVNEYVSGCKNAFLVQDKAKGKKKIGIEHAAKEDIIEALTLLVTYDSQTNTLSWSDFCDLGLNGKKHSKEVRYKLGQKLSIGEANAKTLFKRLNMLKMTVDELKEKIQELSK